MNQYDLSCLIQGDRFSPQAAERETGLTLVAKNEPGEQGERGRYRGQPIPYGAANLDAPSDLPWASKWTWLLSALSAHIQTLRRLGAETVVLDLGYFYEHQCTLEFTPEQLREVAALGIPFTISCYEGSGDE